MMDKLTFEVLDTKTGKLNRKIGGIGINQDGEIISADLRFDPNVGYWTELGDRYLLRANLNGIKIYEQLEKERRTR